MKKLMEVVKRQTELSSKAAAGSATKEEIAELNKLNAVLKAATEPEKPAETKLATMTLAEFRAWHEKAVKQIEDGDADMSLLAIVKRNIASVKTQAKTKAEDIVAVELPVEKQETDKVAALEERIADLETKLAEKAKQDGQGAAAPAATGTPDAAATGAAKGVAQDLAMEAIDALIAKYTKVKGLVEGGTFTSDDLRKLYEGDWQLKDIICQAAAVLAKAEALKAIADSILPELKKLDESTGSAAGDEGASEGAAGGAEGGAGGEAQGGAAEGSSGSEGTEKGAQGHKPGSRWESGLDMAPALTTAKEQHQAIKAAKSKHGF